MGKRQKVSDIHPKTPIASLQRNFDTPELESCFEIALVAALVGMSSSFIRRVLNKKKNLVSLEEVLMLLDQDAFSETFVPRSRIPNYLLSLKKDQTLIISSEASHLLMLGNAKSLIPNLPKASIQCVITSTPYWAMRIYEDVTEVSWADGELCAFGHEQTPEGFIRHTVEILYLLKTVMKPEGSVWWNLMDTYNTRTQIRGNAAETLRAMRGEDKRSWKDYHCRRYSAGHSFLEDGEQSLIPSRIAERASRIGYFIKSVISWKKNGSMPETVDTRVTREVEYILHLTLRRSPYFDKGAFLRLPEVLGGRNQKFEAEKITDVWSFSTANGTDGHGAQFPLALPARCIALSSHEDDLVLDPFIGSGTTSVAAKLLNRRSIGFDVSPAYINISQERLNLTPTSITPTPLNGKNGKDSYLYKNEPDLDKTKQLQLCEKVVSY